MLNTETTSHDLLCYDFSPVLYGSYHDNVNGRCQYYSFWDSDTYDKTAGLATGKNKLASGMKTFTDKEEPYKVRCWGEHSGSCPGGKVP